MGNFAGYHPEGAVAVLLESPSSTNFVDKLQVRLMYNSKIPWKFRSFLPMIPLRDAPGTELLQQEVMLTNNKSDSVGSASTWLTGISALMRSDSLWDLSGLNPCADRANMLAGLRDWERWKGRGKYEAGNKKVESV